MPTQVSQPVTKRPISIKDIARAANVSYSTVSRALRNSDLVKPETRARVSRWAQKLNYTTNSIARGLVTRQSRTVGLVVTTIADPFLGEVVDGIEKIALERGYSVLLCNGHSDPERELSIIRSFQERRVDGVLVIATRMASLYLDRLCKLEVPIVLINNLNPLDGKQEIYSIAIDNFRASRTAVDHVISLGHRRIAYIADEKGDQSNCDRMAGYRSALLEAGITFDSRLVKQGDGTPAGGAAAMTQLLAEQGRSWSAVFCYNDLTAVGALKTLREASLHVPRDVSVLGFDDISLSSYVNLTTVRQPKFQMGGLATEMILKRIEGRGIVTSVTVPGELIIRGTTAAPAQ